MPDPIKVEGLKQALAAIKQIGDPTATREFKQAGRNVAADVVTPKAQARAAALGPMFAKAATTIRPVTVATGAAVRFGGSVPFAMGAEFGAAQNQLRNTRRGTLHGWNQFKPWHGSGEDAGYFLWPTIHGAYDEILAKFEDGLNTLADRLFPGGTT